MIRNYFKIAYRNLLKNKVFSFINIFGLASGMAVCLLALTKIKGAYDYDTFHPDAGRTYRITTEYTAHKGEQPLLLASSPLPLGAYLKNNFDAIERFTRVHFSNGQASANNKTLFKNGVYADPDFYRIFGFGLKTGYPAIDPQTIVLTEETAYLFFGTANPLGHTITVDKKDFVITGVLKKPPYPSHLQFDFLASMSTLSLGEQKDRLTDWADEASGYTYVQLKKGTAATALKTILTETTRNANALFLTTSNKKYNFQYQPLTKISPAAKPIYNSTDEPIMKNLVGFGLIGFIMLLLAFFNYINLTLARSLDRAREVGIRKVNGALKYQLMMQFLCESLVMALLAFGIAQLEFKLLGRMPTIYRLVGEVSQDKVLWLYFIGFTILTGLLAGWIPARVLSRFNPVEVLKGKFNTRLFGGIGLRKTLTIIQFSVSLIALVVLVVFYRQSVYMTTADYGFARENILTIPLPAPEYQRAAVRFSALAGVEDVSGTSQLFGFSSGDRKQIRRDKISDSSLATFFSVTPSFINDMQLKLLAGTNLPVQSADSKTRYAVINEAASRQLQYRKYSEAIGKMIWLNDSTTYQIAGIVQDFHYANFKNRIQPLVLIDQPGELAILNLKIAARATATVLPQLESVWKRLYPHQPFEASWFAKALYEQHLHKDDLQFMGVLTGMALTIACLGLLGMVMYTTKNRSKEIGIRRVLGAEVGQVMIVISKEFILLLALAVSIGLPVGALLGNELLQQYVYRIPVGFGLLTSSAAALLLIGGVTIGWQTYRASLTNPVKNLRTE